MGSQLEIFPEMMQEQNFSSWAEYETFLQDTNNGELWLSYSAHGEISLDLTIQGEEISPAVPIPGAVWLLGTGLLGLIGYRRKINK